MIGYDSRAAMDACVVAESPPGAVAGTTPSMVERATVLIAVANDHWVTGTAIPQFQLAATRAWARLFHLPYLSAVNL